MRAALLLGLLLLSAGCIGATDDTDVEPQNITEDLLDPAATIHRGTEALTPSALPAGLPVPTIAALDTGHAGAEPTLGVTSDGTIFYVAFEKVLRSSDHGASWEVVHEFPTTLDPMLWVDADTDRVFVNHLYLACSVLAYSDDLGETWITNPVACGLPVNDHQKIATAPATKSPIPTTPLYPNLVLYAYNGIALGSRISISYDGGLTFPVNTETVAPTNPDSCSGGLHGHPEAAPDGTIYLPKRACDGFIASVSNDGGLTWSAQLVGSDVGGTDCRKNPEIATDLASNAYGFWPAADQELYMARTTDGGATWGTSVKVSPPEMEVVTMPVAKAGSPGRIAVAYYGIERSETEDAVPDQVDEDGRWHLYVSYTINGLDEEPTWVTVQVTDDEDPIQIGPISTNSGCDNPPGSRNLLDFIDLVYDSDGRVYVAYGDGCTSGCAGKADAEMDDSRARDAYVALVQGGPSLFEDVGVLPMLE